jgi:hypothetical protein
MVPNHVGHASFAAAGRLGHVDGMAADERADMARRRGIIHRSPAQPRSDDAPRVTR